jgi:hypothetical protein
VPPGKLPSGVVRRQWALVIGISQFADKKIPQLNYPAKDAKDFAAPLDLCRCPRSGFRSVTAKFKV